ncbi:MAG: ATP-binding protein [Microbacteriaceae bacterium]
MDRTWWLVLALLVGLALGAALCWLVLKGRERGQHISAVVNPSLPDGIDEVLLAIDSLGVVLDFSHNVIRVTPGAKRLGLVQGHQLAFPQILTLVDQVQSTGEALNAQVHIPRDGVSPADLFLSVRVAPLGLRYTMILVRDMSEAQRVEETRSDFIANVSHELKTPIGAVKLLAEAIESAKDSPSDVERFSHKLSLEANRLNNLTRDLIELSRLQSAIQPHQASLVSLDDALGAAIGNNVVQANAHNIELVLGKASGAEVMGDSAQLISAVSNLISNAINYSPDGSRVGIGIKETDEQYEIAVTDQGVGIPLADQARIFERFYRVSQSRNRESGGTGIGLSIVKHVVRIHGGDVKLWSQLKLGSTFTICLPKSETMVAEQGES